MFSRLQGQNAGTFKGTEGHKYYGRTLITDLLRFVNAGANDGDFKKLIDESAQQHQLRNVNKQQFLVSLLALYCFVFNLCKDP